MLSKSYEVNVSLRHTNHSRSATMNVNLPRVYVNSPQQEEYLVKEAVMDRLSIRTEQRHGVHDNLIVTADVATDRGMHLGSFSMPIDTFRYTSQAEIQAYASHTIRDQIVVRIVQRTVGGRVDNSSWRRQGEDFVFSLASEAEIERQEWMERTYATARLKSDEYVLKIFEDANRAEERRSALGANVAEPSRQMAEVAPSPRPGTDVSKLHGHPGREVADLYTDIGLPVGEGAQELVF